MSYVVTMLSWTGWIWTAAFFAVVIPLLVREAGRRRHGSEVVAGAAAGQRNENG